MDNNQIPRRTRKPPLIQDWTLLVLRDIIFTGARHFRELLAGPERISSNILANRLSALVEHGMLTRAGDPAHRQKITYSLTEQAIDLVPVLVQLSAWGIRHLPAGAGYAARARVLADGGPPLWDAFMDELRETHLGPHARHRPAPAGPTVAERLQAAYASGAVGSVLARRHAGALEAGAAENLEARLDRLLISSGDRTSAGMFGPADRCGTRLGDAYG